MLLICSAISSEAVLYSETRRDNSHLSLLVILTTSSGKAERGIRSPSKASRFKTFLMPEMFWSSLERLSASSWVRLDEVRIIWTLAMPKVSLSFLLATAKSMSDGRLSAMV